MDNHLILAPPKQIADNWYCEGQCAACGRFAAARHVDRDEAGRLLQTLAAQAFCRQGYASVPCQPHQMVK